MKVLPFKIPKPKQSTLVFQENLELIFYDKLHQHEEIQVSLILEGEGTLVVGNTINNYEKGDVFILSGNLPHVFKSELKVNTKSHMLSLFFTKNAFGIDFFNLEEMKGLKPFFKKAENGSKISSSNSRLITLFKQLKYNTKFNQFILLLEILKILAKTNHQNLSSYIYKKEYTDTEGKRMRDIMEFTMNNYQQHISLDTIASIANMTKNAFCKYFKKRTNKTYFTFLNKLRIGYACKLLNKNRDLSITEIALLSGFNNISNFNRKFKLLKKNSPLQYKRTHLMQLF